MDKEWVCECGVMVEGDSEDEVVRKIQEHTRNDHGKEIDRDTALKGIRARGR